MFPKITGDKNEGKMSNNKKVATKPATKKSASKNTQTRISEVYPVNVKSFINEAKGTIDEAKLKDFESRLVIFEPEKIQSKKATNVYSKGYYKNEKGELANLLILAPEQDSWLGASFPYGMPEKNRKLDSVSGFTATFPLNSKATQAKPTLEEEVFRRLLDTIRKKGEAHVEDAFSRKLDAIPTPSSGSYMKNDGDMEKVVKPLYVAGRSDEKNGKSSDFMWLKLEAFGQGSELKCSTELFGPGDKAVHPFAIIGAPNNEKWGRFIKLTPALRWDGLFWGDHKESGFGVSHRMTLYQGSFVPSVGGGVNRVRVVGANPTPATVNTPNVEDNDFEDATTETQADKLKAAGKKSPASTTSAKVQPKKTITVSSTKSTKKAEPEKKEKEAPKPVKKVVKKPEPEPQEEEDNDGEDEGEAESE